MKTHLVLVADRAHSRVYRVRAQNGGPELLAEIENPAGHGHDRDYASSRPGRVVGGGGTRHAFEDHETLREHETVAYVHRVAALLESARAGEPGAHVIIAAAPPMLGLLRQHVYLPRQPEVLEWPHNLSALPTHMLEERLRELCLQH
ncbi:MAG: hypothetical protein RJB26_1941 [Pseudomonadota bacterium]|jgi:protein required for attachment to host cells